MSILETILKRESVRAYMDIPVPTELLERILEAGRWAPNAGPFQISVIRNASLRKEINDRTREAMLQSGHPFAIERASLPGYQPLYGAPVLVLLSAPADAPPAPFNTALAAENMILEATSLGLGSCFLLSPTRALNGESGRPLKQKSGIPDGYRFQCAVAIGYPASENKFQLGERKIKGSVRWLD